MKNSGLDCLLRRDYEPAQLLAAHPPVIHHSAKQVVFDLSCPPRAVHSGTIALTRWGAARLPARLAAAGTRVEVSAGFYDYQGGDAGVWHVNFADPYLFAAYGSHMLAQDELQTAEHPLLGSLREALEAEGQPPLTVEDGVPTPILIAGVERRCAIDTAPNPAAGRPDGLYGNRFADAPYRTLRDAVRVIHPPTRSNLISIAAPECGWGIYRAEEIERIVVTAFTGYSAALQESRHLWPGTPVEIRTGFWGCGAFGGNRHAMILLQALAARLAGVDRLRIYAADAAGGDDARTGLELLDRTMAEGRPGEGLPDLLARIQKLNFPWGTSDGN